MVGGLAGLGPPFLGILADDLDGRAEGRDLDLADSRRVADLAAQVERRGDRRLAVILGRYELDRGLREHPVVGGWAAELGEREWAGDLLEEAHLALEERSGAGHAVGGEQGREDAVPRRRMRMHNLSTSRARRRGSVAVPCRSCRRFPGRARSARARARAAWRRPASPRASRRSCGPSLGRGCWRRRRGGTGPRRRRPRRRSRLCRRRRRAGRRPSRRPSCRWGGRARARDRCRCNRGSGYGRRWRMRPSRARTSRRRSG